MTPSLCSLLARLCRSRTGPSFIWNPRLCLCFSAHVIVSAWLGGARAGIFCGRAVKSWLLTAFFRRRGLLPQSPAKWRVGSGEGGRSGAVAAQPLSEKLAAQERELIVGNSEISELPRASLHHKPHLASPHTIGIEVAPLSIRRRNQMTLGLDASVHDGLRLLCGEPWSGGLPGSGSWGSRLHDLARVLVIAPRQIRCSMMPAMSRRPKLCRSQVPPPICLRRSKLPVAPAGPEM